MIEILLPVYNGEKFLAEQLDSIINQTYRDWFIKIRNDGSIDRSEEIIIDYCNRFPNKIYNISDYKSNIGLVKSLNYLASTPPFGDYIMFADQDDVWIKDKIQKTFDSIIDEENRNPQIPILVCTDSTCVDENLNTIHESFFKSQKFYDSILHSKNKMLAINVVQGCTVMLNRNGVERSFPIPDVVRVHDGWISVVIKHYGVVKYLHYQTLLYRQHSTNELGEINPNFNYYLKRLKKSITTLRRINRKIKLLPFKTNIITIIFYKIFFAFKRCLN